MNTTEAAHRMLDGEIGLFGVHEFRWSAGRFQCRMQGSNSEWSPTRLPEESRGWQIRCEPKPQETERWVRVDKEDGLAFRSPNGKATEHLGILVDYYGTRLVGYEFEGYGELQPSHTMWERIVSGVPVLSQFPARRLDLGQLRKASSVILLKKEA